MTSLSFNDIFDNFLGSITDYNIASLDKKDAYVLMSEYLYKTLSQSYIRRLFSTLSIDKDMEIISFEMKTVVDETADTDFVIGVLTKGMVVEWLKPQVRSKVNIAQMFGGKEAKWFSQAQHITELRAMLEDAQLELKKEIRDRGYIYNSYLEES